MLATILGILWFILKIILWIILGMIGLLLLLVLIVLLVPIRYQLEGSKYETINAKGKITYLLRLIRVTFEYSPYGYAYKVKVLFFTVLKESVQHEKTEEAVPEGSTVQSKAVDDRVEEISSTNEDGIIEKTSEVQGAKVQDTDEPRVIVKEPEEKKVQEEKPKVKGSKGKKPKDKKDKKKEQKKGDSPLDQFKSFYAFLREDRNRGVLKFIIRRLLKAIGSILPKRFYGKVHFGLDDPALTGYILGAVCTFYHKYKDSLTVTADFENPVIEGEMKIKGRIIPGIFVWTLIRIYLDPRVRRLIKKVRGKKAKKKVRKAVRQ